MAEESQPPRYVKLIRDQEAPAEDICPGELNQPVHVLQPGCRKCAECGQVLPESYQLPADEAWSTGIFGCTADQPIPGAIKILLRWADTSESVRIQPDTSPMRIPLNPLKSKGTSFEDSQHGHEFMSKGRTGLFCPCVLFGRNVASLKEDTPWTAPCVCHAIFVEGGITLAILTAIFHGVDPSTSFLIGEGLMFSWWLCSTYTGVFRQELQRKYHLKNSPSDPCMVHCCLHWCANCQEHRERRGHLAEREDGVQMTIVDAPPVEEMGMPRESSCCL